MSIGSSTSRYTWVVKSAGMSVGSNAMNGEVGMCACWEPGDGTGHELSSKVMASVAPGWRRRMEA